MTFAETAGLGAIAGFTIFLGLPAARVRQPHRTWQAFLNALASGILVFLLWDILSKAKEPVVHAMDDARAGEAAGPFAGLLALFALGFGVGLIGLVVFERGLMRGRKVDGDVSPARLAMMIATAIGVHNFAEGLAIGQASREGAIQLAAMLLIGFGLHNMTEGFGIAGPLTGSRVPSWSFLGLAGLIGGGPTFVGTVVGYSVQSTPVFVLCLALAAGSILYVVGELLNVGRRFQMPRLVSCGLFGGFIAGFGTDLLLSYAGG